MLANYTRGKYEKIRGGFFRGQIRGRYFVLLLGLAFLFVGIACRVYCKLKAIYQHLAVKNICQVLRERKHPAGGGRHPCHLARAHSNFFQNSNPFNVFLLPTVIIHTVIKTLDISAAKNYYLLCISLFSILPFPRGDCCGEFFT